MNVFVFLCLYFSVYLAAAEFVGFFQIASYSVLLYMCLTVSHFSSRYVCLLVSHSLSLSLSISIIFSNCLLFVSLFYSENYFVFLTDYCVFLWMTIYLHNSMPLCFSFYVCISHRAKLMHCFFFRVYLLMSYVYVWLFPPQFRSYSFV
jgi:hypothetical protein